MYIYCHAIDTRLGSLGLQAEAEPDECLITPLRDPSGTSTNTEFSVVLVGMCIHVELMSSDVTTHKLHMMP